MQHNSTYATWGSWDGQMCNVKFHRRMEWKKKKKEKWKWSHVIKEEKGKEQSGKYKKYKSVWGAKKEKQMYGLGYRSCNIIAPKRSSGKHGLKIKARISWGISNRPETLHLSSLSSQVFHRIIWLANVHAIAIYYHFIGNFL